MSDFGRRVIESDFGRPPTLPPRTLAILVIVALAVVIVGWAALSSFFEVQEGRIALIRRFGNYHRQVGAGIHFKLPAPIEKVDIVWVEEQKKEEFGFRTISASTRTQYSSEKRVEESYMLTGDLNVVDVQWIVQYRVADPVKWQYRIDDPRRTIRDVSEAVMRKQVGDHSFQEVLKTSRTEIESSVRRKMEETLARYDVGVAVRLVKLQDVQPPEQVRESFNEVNRAEQEMEQAINEAEREYNRQVIRAQGEAQLIIQRAEGYATDRVNRSRGDAERFKAQLGEYVKAPEVTRRRLYLETMGDVLPRVQRKIVIDDDVGSLVPLLGLGGGVSP